MQARRIRQMKNEALIKQITAKETCIWRQHAKSIMDIYNIGDQHLDLDKAH